MKKGSGRGKVPLSPADVKENIEIEHITEAIQYRSLDKKYF